MPHFFYGNQDITVDVLMKIEEVVRILSERLEKTFDETLGLFYKSKTFKALKNPETEMWAESAQFIADDYFRNDCKTSGSRF